MKIIIAPDSFKGSLSSQKAAAAIAGSARRVFPKVEIVTIPIADGGEGTARAMVEAAGGSLKKARVSGPMGKLVTAAYADLGETAVIEMAEASGLALVADDDKNPLEATTFGTGQLIRFALDAGFKKIIVAIGGSATNDGGTGAMQALGVAFHDDEGNDLGVMCGEKLDKIAHIDISKIDERLKNTDISVMCDVNNPLTGPNGATCVYGPQKGADEARLKILEDGMCHYRQKLKAQFGKDMGKQSGTGAAGGLGAALMAFCEARLVSGIDAVLNAANFEDHLTGADIVITGEGCVDYQSAKGKVVNGITLRANKKNVPVIVIAGSVGEGIDKVYDLGVKAIFALPNAPMTLETSMQRAEELIASTAYNIFRLLG